MSWTTFHAESEKLAIEAHLATKSREYERAYELYRRAAEAEYHALGLVDPSKLRTRAVTAVSAVALWFKAQEYAAAEQLAHQMLADATVPEFARSDLRNLVQAIWTEASKKSAGVAFLPGQVAVSVRGGEVVTGGAPLDLIVEKVQTIQSLFYRTIEYLQGASHRRSGRPSREIQDACRPWLFQAAPGSYQFTVAIQTPAQPDFFKADVEPERVATHFLDVVGASASDDAARMEVLVPDPTYRSTFLKLTRNLAPTGKSFDAIELRGAGDARPVSLGIEARVNIRKALKMEQAPSVLSASTVEELRGTLRAVHLDKDWLDIMVDGVPTHVIGLEDAVDDVIGPMVNKQIIVRVNRSAGKLFYVDIELAE
ncbi:hypothetical protein [Dokdonella sp.]|uniref:hypothetical protein n=1 Tax=Dokdonella sp. TaxID=2291710 RepID=UPI001B063E54|nr:hypothetical protein [Dokdonella sp.]MBO9664948.1 hypothetical protein [Dokdonella sp.]